MRIWDISAERLCRSHLLGEHGELHAIWSILTKNKKGYLHHPEVLSMDGASESPYLRHGRLVAEMGRRGYRHKTAPSVSAWPEAPRGRGILLIPIMNR